MEEIKGFQGKYRFLSNFWSVSISFDGEIYPTVEHAYQAAKTLDQQWRMRIRQAGKPGDAKKIGGKVPIRSDWEEIKLKVMRNLVWQKFNENVPLKEALLATGDAKLIEGNQWGDTFWGIYRGRGLNHLGRILMNVRKELRKA